MYGVSLSDHIIVAAGSVVTKSFTEPGVIIGGNPARVIGSCQEFASRYQKHAFDLDVIDKNQLQRTIEHSDKLVKR